MYTVLSSAPPTSVRARSRNAQTEPITKPLTKPRYPGCHKTHDKAHMHSQPHTLPIPNPSSHTCPQCSHTCPVPKSTGECLIEISNPPHESYLRCFTCTATSAPPSCKAMWPGEEQPATTLLAKTIYNQCGCLSICQASNNAPASPPPPPHTARLLGLRLATQRTHPPTHKLCKPS